MNVKRLGFRTRVFLLFVLFAVVPSTALVIGGAYVAGHTLPVLGANKAWEDVAESGRRAIAAIPRSRLTQEQRRALDAHEQQLEASLTQARRFRFLASRSAAPVVVMALTLTLVVAVLASRLAGHVSRQLGRPLNELVGWTELIARGKALPEGSLGRGAPEFETLRRRMRKMARELQSARATELEAERLSAFRETARRVAHELKNPLTPIRFAVERLKREVPASLGETVEVLETESRRLEEMARSFAQFGKLPEGPSADIDIGELARYSARATVPSRIPLAMNIENGLPMVRGHYEELARAVSNVLINAVEACTNGGGVDVNVSLLRVNGNDAVRLTVRDTGCGIPKDVLARIWEPYVTSKAGGTGLGLAIARQTVVAHKGEVSVTSSVDGRPGTEISFVLPASGAT
ncbi:MAG: PAS domain-containing sensor histidine kinase [Gemmatimonadaceae bacterium]